MAALTTQQVSGVTATKTSGASSMSSALPLHSRVSRFAVTFVISLFGCSQFLFLFFIFPLFLSGTFYWLDQPNKLTFAEAIQACLDDGAEIAKVGHIFSAWHLEGYDRCDAGWLADGSVRYPISRPRMNCSPTEAAVRFVGFPDKTQKSYGVYCYKAQE